MNILFKRNYKLIIVFLLLISFGILFNGTRIISYNFGKYTTELEVVEQNYVSQVEIFDDSTVHEIDLDITIDQYEYMMESYKINKEKDYIQTNIIIDGELIEDVGVRLKGSIDLLEIVYEEDGEETEEEFIKPSLLVEFDKYIEGQKYEGLSEIALRVDDEESLLGQLISYKIYEEVGLYAPESGYATVSLGDMGDYLYIVSEVIDQEFVDSTFDNSDGVLYKALNSVSFTYLGDDPTLYVDLFQQKTSINNYDLMKLIRVLEFVTTSTAEEFEENLEDYIDIESYIGMIAMNEVLGNENVALGLLNNYYIYVDTETNIASFIVWDQKLSFGNVGESLENILFKYYTTNDLSNLGKIDIRAFLKFSNTGEREDFEGNGVKERGEREEKGDRGENEDVYIDDLKMRLLTVDKYNQMYEDKLEEYKSTVYNDGLTSSLLTYYSDVFLSYDDYSSYITLGAFNYSIDLINSYLSDIITNLED